ncbi:fatty acid desaturase family protein [Sorangium sp. So ce1128]
MHRPETPPKHVSIAKRLRRAHGIKVRALPLEPPRTPVVLGYLALHVGLGVGAALVCHHLLHHRPGLGMLLYLPTAFWIGTRFRALGNMIHEASHNTLVRGRRMNRVLGHVLSIVDFVSFDEYVREHQSHHAYLGHPARDLDLSRRLRFGFREAGPGIGWIHLLRPLLLLHVPALFGPTFFRKADPWQVSLGRVLFLAGLGALCAAIGASAFTLFYLVPFVLTYSVLRYWSDALDHAGCVDPSGDEFHLARNHIARSRPLNSFLFPRNDQYHLVHHLFPAVPTSMLPRVHDILLQDGSYARREHGLVGAIWPQARGTTAE